TVPRPAEAVCTRPHSPPHSAHGLRSAELHGTGPGWPPHARGQLHPGGLSAARRVRRAQGWAGTRAWHRAAVTHRGCSPAAARELNPPGCSTLGLLARPVGNIQQDGPDPQHGHSRSFLPTKRLQVTQFLTPFYTLCFNVWRFSLLSVRFGFIFRF
ncbi:transmembrane protein 28, isoform CRA_a, partial [Mus musculus]